MIFTLTEPDAEIVFISTVKEYNYDEEIFLIVPRKNCVICKDFLLLHKYHKKATGLLGYDDQCIKCKNARDRRTQRKYKIKYPNLCASCRNHRALQSNLNCEGCNTELGLKECFRCKQVLLKYVDFNQNATICLTCKPNKSKTSVLMDWLVLDPD